MQFPNIRPIFFPDESKEAEDKNKNCKRTTEDNEIPDTSKDDKKFVDKNFDGTSISHKSEHGESNLNEVIENPAWDFGTPPKSKGSTAFSIVESSPSKTPKESSDQLDKPSADVDERLTKEYAQSKAEDKKNRKQETKDDILSLNIDTSVKSGTLNDRSKDEKEEKNVCANESAVDEKVGGKGERNIATSQPEYIRFVSQEMTLLEVSFPACRRKKILTCFFSLLIKEKGML